MRHVAREARGDADWRRSGRRIQRRGGLRHSSRGWLEQLQRGGNRVSDRNPGGRDYRRHLRLFVDPVPAVGRAVASAATASANTGATGFTTPVNRAAINGATAWIATATNLNADPDPGINVNLDDNAAERKSNLDAAAGDRDPNADGAAGDRDSNADAAAGDRDPNVDAAAGDRDPNIDAAAADRDPDAAAATPTTCSATSSFSGATASYPLRNQLRATDRPTRCAFWVPELGPE